MAKKNFWFNSFIWLVFVSILYGSSLKKIMLVAIFSLKVLVTVNR